VRIDLTVYIVVGTTQYGLTIKRDLQLRDLQLRDLQLRLYCISFHERWIMELSKFTVLDSFVQEYPKQTHKTQEYKYDVMCRLYVAYFRLW